MALALWAGTTWAGNKTTITGTVVGVTNGDTITLLEDNHTQVKVRLAQIDAPEKKQDFGQRSNRDAIRHDLSENSFSGCG
jgi:micrococcal nuclease